MKARSFPLVDDAEALALMLEAAAAGAAILVDESAHAVGARPAFERKASDIDLVTTSDRASEAAIVEILRRSGWRIVAEESAEEGADEDPQEGGGGSRGSDPVFFVDPLDGTTNFAHGHPFCCVSIGLVCAEEPVLGVVHAPFLDVVWSGGPTIGATRRDLARGFAQPLAVSTVDAIEDALLATGFPYDRQNSDDDNLAPHGAMMKRAQGVLRCGSAAMDLALVADGTYDGYWERKLKPWDVAAGGALVLAAGGLLTDPWGEPFDVSAGEVLASSPALHPLLRDALVPHLPARRSSARRSTRQ